MVIWRKGRISHRFVLFKLVIFTFAGQNSIIVVGGANELLTSDDVDAAFAKIKSVKVVVCQLEVKPATTLSALKTAKKHRCK